MKPRSLLSATAPSALLLLSAAAVRPTNALSLFGFGSSSESTAEAKARAAAVALIKENAAADVFTPPALGVGRRDAARFEAARAAGKLVCSAGGGDSASTAEIAWDRVNDDFCDCPHDGSDEPGTSACSNGFFECANRGHRSVRLPSSRVGDGVCDCCDGSDEPAGACRASCEEASEAWVASLADRVVKVDKGTARRAEYAQAASEAAEDRAREIEDTKLAAEDAREKLARAKEELAALEETETQQREGKLAEAEKAVSERTKGVLDDPDRLAALAVAVASSEEPLVTLETLCQAVLDGVDVETALRDLLNKGKDKKGGGSTPKDLAEEEEAFLHSEHEDLELEMGYDDHPYDGGMHLDDDYGGYYGGGYDGGYGGEFGDFEDDLYGDLGAAEVGGADGAPVPEVESKPEPELKQAAETANSKVVVDTSDDVGVEDALAGGDGSEIKEGEQEGLKQPEEEQKPKPFKPPHQFKTFKFDTPEAVEGRKQVKDLGDDVKAHEKKIKTLEEEASTDFGDDGALWPLKDKCVSAKTGGYEYRVCPFKDAHQEEGRSKTSIGKWKGIERADNAGSSTNEAGEETPFIFSGDVLVFDKGQKCWNGPTRSLRVALACGPEDALSAVAEPETCTYTAVLETPAACSAALREALVASSKVEAAGGEKEVRRADGGADGEL